MKISGSRIINIESRLTHLSTNEEFRVSYTIDSDAKLKRAGFDTPTSGDTILPPIKGRVSRFNAEGGFNVRNDLPKESRYMYTRMWRWKDWGGTEHEKQTDFYRDCYPREEIPAPAIELTYYEEAGVRKIISPVFKNQKSQHERIKHTINLFLELFDSCDLVSKNLVPIEIPVRQVNWEFLPQGSYPWTKMSAYLKQVLKGKGETRATVIVDRQATLYSFSPAEIGVGRGGFSDYLAYFFPKKGLVVLESIARGNALYIFESGWEKFSQMTKAQVIQGNYQKKRIIHATGWKKKLGDILKP